MIFLWDVKNRAKWNQCKMESNICTYVCALRKAKVECPANEVGNDFKVTKSIPKFSRKSWTSTRYIFQKLDKYHSSDWITIYMHDLE